MEDTNEIQFTPAQFPTNDGVPESEQVQNIDGSLTVPTEPMQGALYPEDMPLTRGPVTLDGSHARTTLAPVDGLRASRLEALHAMWAAGESAAARKMAERDYMTAELLNYLNTDARCTPEERNAFVGRQIAECYGRGNDPYEVAWDLVLRASRGKAEFDANAEMVRGCRGMDDFYKAIATLDEQLAKHQSEDVRQANDSLTRMSAWMGGGDDWTEQDWGNVVKALSQEQLQRVKAVRAFMVQNVKPLEKEESAETVLRKLDGMEKPLLDLIGDDKELAVEVYGTLMDWAGKLSSSNKVGVWDEFQVSVGKKLSNWARVHEASNLGYMSAGYLAPTGNPDWPMQTVSKETSAWAKEQLDSQLRARTEKARAILRSAVNEGLRISDSEHWLRGSLRAASAFAGDTLPYLIPGGGAYLGTADALVRGVAETAGQYRLDYWAGNEGGYQNEKAAEVAAARDTILDTLVELTPFGHVGGKGLSGVLRLCKRKPGSLSAWVTKQTQRNMFTAVGAEGVASFLDEAVLEPFVGGVATLGTDFVFDKLGVQHGSSADMRQAFGELSAIWTDPKQLTGLTLFTAALTGAQVPGLRANLRRFTKDRNMLEAAGLTEEESIRISSMTNPDERVKAAQEAKQEGWKNDPEGMRKRMLEKNERLASAGGALFYTGQSADPALDPNGELAPAFAAVWNEWVQAGLLPEVESTGDGQYHITKKDAQGNVTLDVTLDGEKADTLLMGELDALDKKMADLQRGRFAPTMRGSMLSEVEKIAGRATERAVKENGQAEGVDLKSLTDVLPSMIAERVKAQGYFSLRDMQDTMEWARGQIDALVKDGVTEEDAAKRPYAQGVAQSYGDLMTWAAQLSAGFSHRASMAGADARSTWTRVFRQRGDRTFSLDGRDVLASLLYSVEGEASPRQHLEDVVESYLDQVAQARAAALQEEGVNAAEAEQKAWQELGEQIKAAREAALAADPQMQIEAWDGSRLSIIENFSTLAVADFLHSEAVPAFMQSLQAAARGIVQTASAIDTVHRAMQAARKSSPDAMAGMEKMLSDMGVRVQRIFSTAHIEAQDIQAWKAAYANARNKANGPQGAGGESVTQARKEAEEHEKEIAEHEKAPTLQAERDKKAAEPMERALAMQPQANAPQGMQGVFVGDQCVHQPAGNFYCGRVPKERLKDGTEQVKKGEKGKHGVIAGRELTGDFEQTAAPLYVWQRTNGELWVISGRHRFAKILEDDAATDHFCYVFREGDEFAGTEFNEKWARMMDYENNMRDDQADEVTAAVYARETGASDSYMFARGLLRNGSRSKRGIFIGRYAGPELWTRFYDGAISPKDAEIICNMTRGIKDRSRIADIQTRCCVLLAQQKSWEYIGAMAQLLANKEAVTMKQGLLDLGADFEADMERMATFIEKNLHSLNEAIGLLKGEKKRAKQGDKAGRLGLGATMTEEQRETMLDDLNALKAQFELIGSYPDLVAAAQMWDGAAEIDPVAQYLERAAAEREQAQREAGMDAETYLEEQERKEAEEKTPMLFSMSTENVSNEAKGVKACIEGLMSDKKMGTMENPYFNGGSIHVEIGGNKKSKKGETTKATHMIHKRLQMALSEDEAAFVTVVSLKALESASNIGTQNNGNKLFERFGVRAVAMPGTGGYYTLTGFVITTSKDINKDDTAAAKVAAQFYALPAFDRWQKVGALLDKALARFDRIVKQYPNDWEKIIEYEIALLKAKIDGRAENKWMQDDEGNVRMLAPNGKLSNYNERQWCAVRTDSFKDWFGNWEKSPEHASKLLDANGEPRIVYHGTATEGLSVFSHKKAQDKLGRKMALGWGKGKFYLTTSEIGARAAADGAVWQGYGSAPQVMSLFVNVRKPMSLDEYEARYFSLSGHELNEPYADGYGMQERDKYIAALDKSIRKDGYDGIIDEESGAIAVFEANQIKSATDNIMGFSKESDNISFSLIVGMEGVERMEDAAKHIENYNLAVNLLGLRKWADIPRDEQVKIKLATGWEQNIEGRWVLEIPDLNNLFSDVPKEIGDSIKKIIEKQYALIIKINDMWDAHKKKHPDNYMSTYATEYAKESALLKAELEDARKEHDALEMKRRAYGIPKGKLTIGDFAKGTPLEHAYPELMDIAVKFRVLRGNTAGYYSEATREIVICKDLATADAKFRALVHEVQHAVQYRENMPRGGDGRDADYRRLTGEVEARNAAQRTFVPREERTMMGLLGEYNALLEDTEDVPRSEQVVKFADSLRRSLAEVNEGLRNMPTASDSFSMERATLDAMELLRGRAEESVGEQLLKDWRKSCEQWAMLGSKEDGRLGKGAKLLAEMNALISATRKALMGRDGLARLDGLMRWATIYAEMQQSGQAPRSGRLKDDIYEKFVQRMTLTDEKNRLQGMTDAEAREAMAELAGERLDAAMMKVARHCAAELDTFLKERARERMDLLRERLYPKREQGKPWPRGKVTAEMYRLVERIYQVMELNNEQKADLLEEKQRALASLDRGLPDFEEREEALSEDIAILSTYGCWETMGADQARKAEVEFANMLREGRTAWDNKLKQERARTAWVREEILSHFKTKADNSVSEGGEKVAAERGKLKDTLKKVLEGNMNFNQLMLALTPYLGKRFCAEQRRRITEMNANTMTYLGQLEGWMYDTLAKITGLKSETEIERWLNKHNQRYNTGIVLDLPEEIGKAVLTMDEARTWLLMTKEERAARREKVQKEADALEEKPLNVPTEAMMEELAEKVVRTWLWKTDEGKKRWKEEQKAEKKRLGHELSKEEKIALRVKVAQELAKSAKWETDFMSESEAKYTLTETAIRPQTLETTNEAMLFAILTFEQPDYEHLMESNGLDESKLQQMREKVGPELLAWGYAMRDYLNEQGLALADVYERWTGIPFASRAAYFRGVFDIGIAKDGQPDAPDREGGVSATTGKHGILIPRRYHKQRIPWQQMTSATAVFLQTAKEQALYMNTSQFVHEWNALLANKEFARRLTQELGEATPYLLKGWVQLIEGSVVASSRTENALSRIVGKWIGAYAVTRLFGNVYTLIKQVSAVHNGFMGGYVPEKMVMNDAGTRALAYRHIGPGEYTAAFARVMSGHGVFSLGDMAKQDFLRNRMRGKGAKLTAAANLAPNQKVPGALGGAARAFTEFWGGLIGHVDVGANILAAAALADAAYRSIREDDTAGIIPDEAAKAEALRCAAAALDTAAQPVLRTQKSYFVARGSFGSVGKNLYLFRSEAVAKFGLVLSQIQKGEYGYAIGGALMFGVMNTLLLAFIDWLRGNWPGDDDEDKWKKLGTQMGLNVLLGDLQSVPGFAEGIQGTRYGLEEIIEATTGAKMHSKTFQDNSLLEQVFKTSAREAKNVDKGVSWDKHLRSISTLLDSLGAVTGIMQNSTIGPLADVASLTLAAATAGNLSKFVSDVIKKATGED